MLGLLGALALIATEFLTLIEISDDTRVVDSFTGADQHGYALAVLGVAALVLVVVMAVSGSRPAGFALAAVGLVAAIFVLAFDVNAATDSGNPPDNLRTARSQAAAGLWVEVAGAALLLLAAGLALTGPRPEPAEPPERRVSEADARGGAAAPGTGTRRSSRPWWLRRDRGRGDDKPAGRSSLDSWRR